MGGDIIGKPHEECQAVKTLSRLSGSTHHVLTGVSLILKTPNDTLLEEIFVSRTEVEFADATQEQISSYVSSGEPLNKAGAYGIQGLGSVFVKSIIGDYKNVVGLPVYSLCSELSKFL